MRDSRAEQQGKRYFALVDEFKRELIVDALRRSRNSTEVAARLGITVSTVNREVKALKLNAQEFLGKWVDANQVAGDEFNRDVPPPGPAMDPSPPPPGAVTRGVVATSEDPANCSACGRELTPGEMALVVGQAPVCAECTGASAPAAQIGRSDAEAPGEADLPGEEPPA